MEFLVVLAILALVALFVTRPLWHGARARRESRPEPDQIAELEAAREAKYREIRDAELDRRTGKLSEHDFEAVDRALRAEAIEILRALDQAREGVNGHAERLPSAKR
jgi:type II secretory pathway component PulJ